ncbi:prolyl oligopeptidase family serine peptidase [Fuerstiella marisgermanici]|uniref:prolyl oligopeptidase n=1 Tax=Fuerstiella marisgermanici TaxID=1891926 RepID=A0A1P8WMW6_9PLAN|nr:prolyl oligopeptidase family serine peptidase [Fuerstiella marisgermanici]APZ95404.1 Prolyl endopeptidase precursor [Fuerstiella marisgermanici]
MYRLILLTALFAPSFATAQDTNLVYPDTKTVDHHDDYHGTKVHDPYRWLEDDVRESEEVAEWVEAQNKVTFDYLRKLPGRDQIEERITELWNYEKISAPSKEGGRYYFFRNDGLQNQSVLYMQETLDAEPQILIDPNTWSEDGTIALAGTEFSEDGKYAAYGIQDGGSDWRVWKIMEIESGKLLDDELKWIKFSSIAWTPDSKGFFYSRYDEPKEGAKFQSLNLNQKVFYHRVGTDQAEDELVFARPDEPEWGMQASVSEDGKYLVITIWKGTDDRYRIAVKDLTDSDAEPFMLIDNFEHLYGFLDNNDDTLLFQTNLDAPLGRVIAIDLKKPEREHWKQVVAETENALLGIGIVGNRFVGQYLQDAKTQVRWYDMDGKFIREVKFPGIGSASGFGGKRDHKETFYSFSSFAVPTSTYRYDIETGESTLLRQADVKFNPDDYETKQIFYASKDGTKVPMFICHRKGLKLDGNYATLLYGYGGFNISLPPRFSVSRLAWMEMGGVFAMPNLRGGGEYGEPWHKAGTKLNKQNVFDDFIAAAEWLIDNKYTSSKKLAIQGGSNGGLLVGACMTQRPELYAACLPAVGVMDMLRFHKFTAGRFWVDDYGSADNPEEFKALLAYSPYQNLKAGTRYPATLITTADTDDRVVPGHSFKFAAQLQACQSGDKPVLIRIETRAGHGSGKPTAMVIEEVADQWAFLAKHLGLDVSSPE